MTLAPNWNYPLRTLPDYDHGGSITYTVGFDQGGVQNDWAWTVRWGFDVFNGIIYRDDPGIPFTAYDSTTDMSGNSIPMVTGRPILGTTPGSWTVEPPQNVIGKNKDLVNWGLLKYYDIAPTIDSTNCTYPDNYVRVVPIDPLDTGDVSAIETAMQVAYFGGLNIKPRAGTPNKGALDQDKAYFPTLFASDPKNKCDRTYGVILATDGLSNTCNPPGSPGDPPVPWFSPDQGCAINPATGLEECAGGYASGSSPVWFSPGEEWVSPCLGRFGIDAGCADPASPLFGRCCDQYSKANGSGYDCNADYVTSYTLFPPGSSEEIYNLNMTVAGRTLAPVQPRTFVVGISPTVGRCELNYTAYRGRTDASSPNKDAGFDTDNDPRIPKTTEDGTTPDRYGAALGAKKDWAFFATDAKAMAKAFTTIVAATATGDYTTAPPVSGSVLSLGNIVLLPSSEFPTWKGHMYAIDSTKNPGDVGYLRWDAGKALSDPADPGYVAPGSRKIYTWDTSNALVEVIDANQDTLANLAGLPNPSGFDTSAFNTKVIDFIRGNDGTKTSTGRFWRFGPPINATPAVIGPPEIYKQSKLPDHKPFEGAYKTRTALAWVGADDGMLHAFNFTTGAEVVAIIPPNLLKPQVDLYNNYLAGESLTGQNVDLTNHIWGQANSLRYYDVWDGSEYHTMGYLTEGPAGTLLAALDITHPSPTDSNYADFGGDPVRVVWTKSQADFAPVPSLFNTWSVPATAAAAYLDYRLFFGQGQNTASTAAAQVDASFFTVDSWSGAQIGSTKTLAKLAIPAPWVGEQSFADSVFFQTGAPGYFGDNFANLALQADLNGRIWFNYDASAASGFPDVAIGIDATAKAGQSQPLYYPPAVSGLGKSGCQVYAFGSGTAYEQSPTVTGRQIGTSPNFIPQFYLAVNTQTAPVFNTTVPNTQIVTGAFSSFQKPAGSPDYPGPLGVRTMLTSSPFLLVPGDGKGVANALFLLFDPDVGCNGWSYVAIVSFNLTACASDFSVNPITKVDVFAAGAGAASGFALAGTEIVVAKSGIGKGASAGLVKPGVNITAYLGLGNIAPNFWRELK